MKEMASEYTFQWFMKEIRSITVRNLISDNGLQSLPSPRIDILGEDCTTTRISESGNGITTRISDTGNSSSSNKHYVLLFTGDVISNTCNPSWSTSVLRPTSSVKSFDTTSLLFRFNNTKKDYNAPTTTTTLLYEDEITINDLVHLGPLKLSSTSSLPINSIFFQSDYGYFVSKPFYQILSSLNLTSVVNRPLPDSDMSDIINTRSKIINATSAIDVLRDDIKRSFGHFNITKEEITREATLIRLELLKKEVEQAEAEADQEELLLQEEEAILRQTSDLEDTLLKCQNLSSSIKELNESSKARAENLAKTQFIFEARQLKLLSELQSIYPIEQLDNGEYAIRGLELPMDTIQKDDELISSALGYLVHLLLLTSKYLELPLRCQLLFFASRSMIRDPANSTSTAYPLFRRGVERERFDKALILLQKNIDQLLQSRGIPYDSRKSLLYNVHQLFECEMCPKLNL